MRRRVGLTDNDVPGADSVASLLGVALGVGRLAVGAAFVGYPVASVRLLGVDTATAARTAWLARMAAIRDAALGAGLLGSAASRRSVVPWLLAGALTDAGDAAVLAFAVRGRRIGRTRGYLVAGGAAAAAVVGVGSAALSRRR